MAERSPAFSFYPRDFLSDEHCAAMTHEECGAYIRLLCHAWMEGSIPSEPAQLRRLLRISPRTLARIWPAIAPCFRSADNGSDRLTNARIEVERNRQRERAALNSAKGRQGGRPAKSTADESRGFILGKPNESLSSSSSSSSSEEQESLTGLVVSPPPEAPAPRPRAAAGESDPEPELFEPPPPTPKPPSPTDRARAVWPELAAAAARYGRPWGDRPGKAQLALVAARIRDDGLSEADLLAIVHGYVALRGSMPQGGFDPLKYLVPATLFRASKWPDYLAAGKARALSPRDSLERQREIAAAKYDEFMNSEEGRRHFPGYATGTGAIQ